MRHSQFTLPVRSNRSVGSSSSAFSASISLQHLTTLLDALRGNLSDSTDIQQRTFYPFLMWIIAVSLTLTALSNFIHQQVIKTQNNIQNIPKYNRACATL